MADNYLEKKRIEREEREAKAERLKRAAHRKRLEAYKKKIGFCETTPSGSKKAED